MRWNGARRHGPVVTQSRRLGWGLSRRRSVDPQTCPTNVVTLVSTRRDVFLRANPASIEAEPRATNRSHQLSVVCGLHVYVISGANPGLLIAVRRWPTRSLDCADGNNCFDAIDLLSNCQNHLYDTQNSSDCFTDVERFEILYSELPPHYLLSGYRTERCDLILAARQYGYASFISRTKASTAWNAFDMIPAVLLTFTFGHSTTDVINGIGPYLVLKNWVFVRISDFSHKHSQNFRCERLNLQA